MRVVRGGWGGRGSGWRGSGATRVKRDAGRDGWGGREAGRGRDATRADHGPGSGAEWGHPRANSSTIETTNATAPSARTPAASRETKRTTGEFRVRRMRCGTPRR